jgi:hypothetical protein
LPRFCTTAPVAYELPSTYCVTPLHAPPPDEDDDELLLELEELEELELLELDELELLELLLEELPVPHEPRFDQTPSGPELVAGLLFCVHHLA